ncbi:hypothetical protein AJ80_06728 [Polytolypa hystricis UAMH7299]|uniref:Uncharacterized protein n=1 Tax=Polytolypa hystricis (strain UAMH7299) TaxID=1447883 RepID=A0A2B7XUH9_POLH7|nr:hypothetical protein AJ80_06728 [Polytolypa hystricis UAMH7299]
MATEINSLTSKWPTTLQVSRACEPGRFEGEGADLMGRFPPEINGTFYRTKVDPFFHQQPEDTIPIEGDAFRIHKGRVDMKVKYVDIK